MNADHNRPLQTRGPNSRSKLACHECRRKHVKCDLQIPCRSCRRHAIKCSLASPNTFVALEWKAHDSVAKEQCHGLETRPTKSVASIVGFVDQTAKVSEAYRVVTDTSLPIDRVDGPYEQEKTQRSTAKTSNLPLIPGPPLTNERDAFYMSRYVENLGPWFDLFDSTDKHFSTVVPQLALSNDLVLYACLASAARQYSLVSDSGRGDALEYYNIALRTLHNHLDHHGHEPATFASCLLIAHCEMIESHASDWNVHLQGTRELVTTQGWNAASGGLAQACFWIFCRMMILASISLFTITPLHTERWLPTPTFLDPPQWTFDTWSSKIVYLLGCAHNLRCSMRHLAPSKGSEQLASQWQYLYSELQQLGIDCPPMCRPISVLPAKPNSADQPFESVYYINGSIAAAWQMFHTVQMILTICSPATDYGQTSSSGVNKSDIEILAKKIVSNSISNRFPVAWVTAVQLLTSAGKWLMEPIEKQACALVLGNIRSRTGWNTIDDAEMVVRYG